MTLATPDAGIDSAVDVTVLVPVLNEAHCIRDTARGMLAQRFDGRLEFLFLDGGSSDGTRSTLDELAQADPRVRVLNNPARIIPAALNIGLRHAEGRYIARMDAHAWYGPDYVALGVRRLQAGDTTWVAGPAVPAGTNAWSRAVAAALALALGRGGSRKWSSPDERSAVTEVELDTGVFGGIWRRDTLRELGGWRESWKVNEDAEMAGRVLSAGGRIVCLSAMAACYTPRDTPAGLARQYWQFGYYRVKTSRRHPAALRRSHVLAAGLAVLPGVAVAAPVPLARAARASLALYVGVLARACARSQVTGARPGDRFSACSALAVMHFSWGAGFWGGCLRFGPPWKALVGVAGLRRRARPSTPGRST